MLVTFEAKQQPRTLGNSSSAQDANDNKDDDHLIQNIDQSNPPDVKIFNFTKKKNKGGCITCKIRKKRCSEERPICADCERLCKTCVWATEDMSVEKIRELKKQVEESEKNSRIKRTRPDKDVSGQVGGDKPKKRKKKKDIKEKSEAHTLSNTEKVDSLLTNQESPMSISNFIDNDIPLDPEMQTRPPQMKPMIPVSSTPISSNLRNFPLRSFSPAQDSFSFSPKQWDFQNGSENLFEFNNFFESNIRNNIDKYSDKITELDGDNQPESSTSGSTALQRIDSFETLLNQNMQMPEPLNMDFSSIPKNPFPSNLNLDNMGVKLYDYYQHRLARIMSIVPAESNYYLKVFLPMAAQNKGILYSILAWSGYHLGGDFEAEGTKYMSKALDFIKDTQVKTENETLQRLANLLIMCGAEICKGDVRKWPVYLEWAAKIIKRRGGLYEFNKDKEQHWLMSSFAYHDILASSTSERGTYFPMEQYIDFVVNLGFGVDPLHGIVKPMFNIIGEISTLVIETKKLLKFTSNSLGYGIMNDDINDADDDDELQNGGNGDSFEVPGIDTPESDKLDYNGANAKLSRYASLSKIMQRASLLENKINTAKPDPNDLNSFTSDELELQLTLFESFQLTAKLHLRQSVLRLNPSSLETQFILCELLKCLDVVLKSSVEGSLCFPLFIAGMNCTTKRDRRRMLARFKDIGERYSFKNLERAKTVMEQVWLVDPSGTRCVDWYEIVKRLGWDVSFA